MPGRIGPGFMDARTQRDFDHGPVGLHRSRLLRSPLPLEARFRNNRSPECW